MEFDVFKAISDLEVLIKEVQRLKNIEDELREAKLTIMEYQEAIRDLGLTEKVEKKIAEGVYPF